MKNIHICFEEILLTKLKWQNKNTIIKLVDLFIFKVLTVF